MHACFSLTRESFGIYGTRANNKACNNKHTCRPARAPPPPLPCGWSLARSKAVSVSNLVRSGIVVIYIASEYTEWPTARQPSSIQAPSDYCSKAVVSSRGFHNECTGRHGSSRSCEKFNTSELRVRLERVRRSVLPLRASFFLRPSSKITVLRFHFAAAFVYFRQTGNHRECERTPAV